MASYASDRLLRINRHIRLRQHAPGTGKRNFRDYLGNKNANTKGMFIFYTVDGACTTIRYDPTNIPPFLNETVKSLEALDGGGKRTEIDLLAIERQVKSLEESNWELHE